MLLRFGTVVVQKLVERRGGFPVINLTRNISVIVRSKTTFLSSLMQKTRPVSTRSCRSRTFRSHQDQSSHSCTQRSSFKKGRNSEDFKGQLGITGFSLALLGFFEKEPVLSQEDKILMEIKRAVLAIQEGELAKAERHLANSWKLSEADNLEEVKTQIMDIQANLAFQKGELDKAIRLFQLVTQRLVFHQGFAVTDNAVVEISIKLAQIFAMKGRDDESFAGFQFCADTQREKIENQGLTDEDTLMLAAWSLQSLAQAYMTAGTERDHIDKSAVGKASDCAQEAYKYASQAVGPDSQQAVAINSDLASILALEGDIEAALIKLGECEKIAAEKHKYLQAAIRVNTGSLYLQKGEYSEAGRICKEAKMMAGMFKDLESVIRADECIAKSNAMQYATSFTKQSNDKNSTNK